MDCDHDREPDWAQVAIQNAEMEADARACPECHGTGTIEGPGCNCGGYGDPFFMHERYCGLEPCPRGCEFVPPSATEAPF